MVSLLVTINTFLYECFEKAKKYPYIWICFVILLAAISLIWLPHWRVSYFGINNATENATLENQYRATIAQILGGVAIGIGIYYTWRRVTIAENSLKHSQETFVANQQIAQENLKVAQDGQITERFTRAVDQLGNDKIEVRLGGIYALERIANESDKDYWQIMEILTTYIRLNSHVEEWEEEYKELKDPKYEQIDSKHKVRFDIQAIINVIGRRKFFYKNGESKRLYLRQTCLRQISLADAPPDGAHLEGVWLDFSVLIGAYLIGAHLIGASFTGSNLNCAQLNGANLTEARLDRAYFRGANLSGANLSGANLLGAHFEGADLTGAHLEGADFTGAYLEGVDFTNVDLREGDSSILENLRAHNLTTDQLSKVKTLYEAKLDDKLRESLKNEYPDRYKQLITKPK